MRSLAQLMGEPTTQQAEGVDPFFAGYGLARNPFPPARTIIPQVLYNQEEALEKFCFSGQKS